MIKFVAFTEDRTLVGFGLSEKNVEKLKEDHPMLIKLKDLGIVDSGVEASKVEILIFYGVTEEAMHAKLKEFINKDTLVFESGKEGNGH